MPTKSMLSKIFVNKVKFIELDFIPRDLAAIEALINFELGEETVVEIKIKLVFYLVYVLQ
jgi:hypothetical protein